jgi:hypothetical protein
LRRMQPSGSCSRHEAVGKGKQQLAGDTLASPRR